MSLPGFTRPGGPVRIKELKEEWIRVYAVLMIINTNDPAKKLTLDRMHDLLAEANESVLEVLKEGF
jgi:hypothetical protein